MIHNREFLFAWQRLTYSERLLQPLLECHTGGARPVAGSITM